MEKQLRAGRAAGGYSIHWVDQATKISLCGHEPRNSSRSSMKRAGWRYFVDQDQATDGGIVGFFPCKKCWVVRADMDANGVEAFTRAEVAKAFNVPVEMLVSPIGDGTATTFEQQVKAAGQEFDEEHGAVLPGEMIGADGRRKKLPPL